MIKVKFIYNREKYTITASGLGDLCWKLDVLGIDTTSEDEDVEILSMEYKK